MEYADRLMAMVEPDIIQGDDGFYVFWPDQERGAYSARDLRIIAGYVDRLNNSMAMEIGAG